jgi:hypothetical protein
VLDERGGHDGSVHPVVGGGLRHNPARLGDRIPELGPQPHRQPRAGPHCRQLKPRFMTLIAPARLSLTRDAAARAVPQRSTATPPPRSAIQRVCVPLFRAQPRTSLVLREVRDEEAAGSNPVTPTVFPQVIPVGAGPCQDQSALSGASLVLSATSAATPTCYTMRRRYQVGRRAARGQTWASRPAACGEQVLARSGDRLGLCGRSGHGHG